MNRSQTILLIALAMCGGFIVVLSFMSWVEFTEDDPHIADTSLAGYSFSLNGSELSRIQGATDFPDAREPIDGFCTCRTAFGDGYLTAILGVVVLAAASSALLIRSRRAALVAMAVFDSVIVVVVGGYNATGIWKGIGLTSGGGELLRLDGDVTFELFTLTAVAALSAVLGAVILMMIARDAREQAVTEIEAEYAEIDEANGWA